MSPLSTRRDFLATIASSVAASRVVFGAPGSTKPMRGAFMILHTPFTEAGAVDWDDLAKEALFVDRAGCAGIVWPQGSSSVATLTKEERLRGMEILAKTLAGRRAAVVLGVQGKDISEMLEFARRAEDLAADAVIAMPPTTGQTMDDYARYFRALADVARRPVIVQTSGGNRALAPSTELIVQLAREFPTFGYVKEETDPIVNRMRDELRNRPPMRGIFGASFADGWLYELRLGLDGVITGNAMYADLMARIWDLHEHAKTDEVRDAYSKFLLMRNLEEQIPGSSLHVMKRRGIFKTTTTRVGPPVPGAPQKVRQVSLPDDAIAEIEYRFAALKPYLLPSAATF